ncbi:DUF349 domain-containing protein [uncultured Polaribacter sp.]|uniref:DUF349 domain-containing protein n=1 Tax=uncultured Polaribacter sp. TaxID=174711 RepID=UPI00262B0FC9|nr:DUF349 domain-containing protein [uncultured Polaribacter sp.]
MLENNDEALKNKDVITTEEINYISENQDLIENLEQIKVSNKEESDENDEVLIEIENSVAENAEKEEFNEEEKEVIDYSKFSLEELAKELKNTIANNPVQKIKAQVDAIKNAFNVKFGALINEKKEVFLAEGGNSIDFHFSSPIKSEYNSLLSDYKKSRDAYYKELENKLNENLQKRLVVIENLKKLIEEADSTTMYKNFKEIQDSWRTIGPVSKTRYNDTWKIYHHHVERFYDLLHLSNDFRDLDFKHNLDEKLKIILRAEALIDEPDINYASKELQDLHKIWKEEIGPVSREMREEVWQKFKDVTRKVHNKRHEHYKELRSKFQEVIDEKHQIIKQIDEFDTSKNRTHKDWQNSIKIIDNLRQQYFSSGKLPYSKSEEVWQKFKNATKKFNASKNIFYKQEKKIQQENLEKKNKLIEIAESLKDSKDWELATSTMKKIQSDWKEIGHVPRKFSDDIWKRFKGACNHYFDKLNEQKNAVSIEQQEIVNAKKQFLEELKVEENSSKEAVLEVINKWKNLGRLPRNARHLDGKFNKQVDKILDTLSLDKNEISMLKFMNVVDGYAEDKDARKLESEQFFIRKKIDEIVKEIQQLENNLGFFSNATDDNPLVINVKNRVEEYKEDLLIWKEKLSYIKKLDF